MQNPKDTAPGANATGKTTLSRRQLLDGGFGIGAVSADRGNCWGGRPRARQYGHVAKHGRRGRQARPRDGPAAASSRKSVVRRTANCAPNLRCGVCLQGHRRLPAVAADLRGQAFPARRSASGLATFCASGSSMGCRPIPIHMPLDMILPHHFNSTNFHFHGSHVSPGGIADNVFRGWSPARVTTWRSRFPTITQRGTYWYHPHKHGSADVQLSSGMAGALIIEGDFDDVPEIAAAERACADPQRGAFRLSRRNRELTRRYGRKPCRASSSVNGQREPTIRYAARRGAALADHPCGTRGQPQSQARRACPACCRL